MKMEKIIHITKYAIASDGLNILNNTIADGILITGPANINATADALDIPKDNRPLMMGTAAIWFNGINAPIKTVTITKTNP